LGSTRQCCTSPEKQHDQKTAINSKGHVAAYENRHDFHITSQKQHLNTSSSTGTYATERKEYWHTRRQIVKANMTETAAVPLALEK